MDLDKIIDSGKKMNLSGEELTRFVQEQSELQENILQKHLESDAKLKALQAQAERELAEVELRKNKEELEFTRQMNLNVHEHNMKLTEAKRQSDEDQLKAELQRQSNDMEENRLERVHELELLDKKSRAAQDVVKHQETLSENRKSAAYQGTAEVEINSKEEEIANLQKKIDRKEAIIRQMMGDIQQKTETVNRLENIKLENELSISKLKNELAVNTDKMNALKEREREITNQNETQHEMTVSLRNDILLLKNIVEDLRRELAEKEITLGAAKETQSILESNIQKQESRLLDQEADLQNHKSQVKSLTVENSEANDSIAALQKEVAYLQSVNSEWEKQCCVVCYQKCCTVM